MSPIWVKLKGSGPGGSWTDGDRRLPREVRQGLLVGDKVGTSLWKERLDKLAAQRLTPLEPHLGAHKTCRRSDTWSS